MVAFQVLILNQHDLKALLAGHQAGAFDEECSCHAKSALPVTAPSTLLCGSSSCDEVADTGSKAFATCRDWQQDPSLQS